MAPKRRTPTVRLRRLAAELRRLRMAADLTREDVGERTGINNATLYRIETARARPQMRTLATLLHLYEVDQTQREYLTGLCREADRQGWLRPYHSELPEEYTAFISFEDEAQTVRDYESLFIPGLLQTEDYARAVIRDTLPSATDGQVEDRVRARMERQGVLSKATPVKFWAVLDEAALRRSVGGTDVMLGQFAHLVEAVKVPNVTFQVVPFSAGAHPGMSGQFIVLDFADPMDTDLIYLESMAGDLFLESDAEISRYRAIFDHLVAVALSPNDSVAMVAGLASEVKGG